jgi:gliding motility-associated-like protein
VIVNPLPLFELTTPQIVCLNGPELVLSVENPQTVYDYTWTTPTGENINGSQISVTSGGTYIIVATTTDGTNCSYQDQIIVNESIIANLTEDNIDIDDESDSNTITIIDPLLLGIGDYEYALLDDEDNLVRPYQDQPIFDNLPGGIYTILVRDKNGCGVASLEVPVIEYPKFFTPNNDGVNDTWAIKGANSFYFPTSEVNIFNRFGKLVAQIDIDNPGWDGTFNGKTLPSDDYWFSIKLIDRDGNLKGMSGNVSLLRK